MIRMQAVAPEIRKLQQRHKDDRETLNREMMAFYQANNINPFSSCLPLLLQMPVFIVLFNVLRGLTRKAADGTFDPKYLDSNSNLHQALSGSTEMFSFGMDLSKSALTELQQEGLVVALPFFLLIVLVAGTQWYQQRQIAGRRGADALVNPQQQMLQKVLPFIIVPFALSFPAGLVVYYVTSNLVRIGQQAVVTELERRHGPRDVIIPESSSPASPNQSAAPKTGGPTTPRAASGRVTNPGARSHQRRKKRK
jgi:YidC/Oxa1 family membrane protein insertase